VSARVRAAALAFLAFASAAGAIHAAPPAEERRSAAAQSLAALRVATLAERIAKLHAQAVQGVLAERARHALAQSVRGLDGAVHELDAAASAPPAPASEVPAA